jgi:MoxR-like ATPase
MSYTRLFDPTGLEDLRREEERQQATTGDRRDGKVYVYDDAGEIVLAVNIALATGRPLLLSGPSGSGKSSLAQHVARVLGRRYYEFVVTARTQAQDLTWRFDAVRRLADAQVEGRLELKTLESIYPYIEPQALWWVFDRESARVRGRTVKAAADASASPGAGDPCDASRSGAPRAEEAADPVRWDPCRVDRDKEWLPDEPQLNSCVLLIDEIDKADPDVPNNLLVELGSLQFDVDLIDRPVTFQGNRHDWRSRPLVIITTNRERPLPQPFVRRCVVLEIPKPKRRLLKSIAARNFPARDAAFFDDVLDAVIASRGSQAAAAPAAAAPAAAARAEQTGGNPAAGQGQPGGRDDEVVEVSIAEYVDTLRACDSLAAKSDELSQELLKEIVKRTVWVVKEKALRPQ